MINSMKHAYLIIVHHEFEILKLLVFTLDDERNDIYIHFDKKVKKLPILEVKKARLFILEHRVDVRWGDVSQIESEFVLFQYAFRNGPYSYYHLLSGVDLPIKSQDHIHAFFYEHRGKEFIGFNSMVADIEIERKVKYYHFFPKYFRRGNGIFAFVIKLIRYCALRLQFLFHVRRNKNVLFKKGTSWVSITNDFVAFVLPLFKNTMRRYHHTFCADEIFLHTICWNSAFRENIFDLKDEGRGCMRMIGWKENQLSDWQDGDFDFLMKSDALFARKFSGNSRGLVYKILDKISSNE